MSRHRAQVYFNRKIMKHNILYSFRRCPYAIRARWALLNTNQVVELREVDLKNKPKELIEISKKGTVPVLHTNLNKIMIEYFNKRLSTLKGNKIYLKLIKIYLYFFGEKNLGDIGFDFSQKLSRIEILNKIISSQKYSSYLEIGTFKDELFFFAKNAFLIRDGNIGE